MIRLIFAPVVFATTAAMHNHAPSVGRISASIAGVTFLLVIVSACEGANPVAVVGEAARVAGLVEPEPVTFELLYDPTASDLSTLEAQLGALADSALERPGSVIAVRALGDHSAGLAILGRFDVPKPPVGREARTAARQRFRTRVVDETLDAARSTCPPDSVHHSLLLQALTTSQQEGAATKRIVVVLTDGKQHEGGRGLSWECKVPSDLAGVDHLLKGRGLLQNLAGTTVVFAEWRLHSSGAKCDFDIADQARLEALWRHIVLRACGEAVFTPGIATSRLLNVGN